MQFREATVPDIPQIQIVRNSVLENRLSDPALVSDRDCQDFIMQRGRGWVCEMNGNNQQSAVGSQQPKAGEQSGIRIVGFAIVDLKENNIWALFVQPGFERMGIGRELHRLMLEWYFSQTDTPVWLGTAPGTRAEDFYRKAGWTESGMHGKGEIKFTMTAETWRAFNEGTGI